MARNSRTRRRGSAWDVPAEALLVGGALAIALAFLGWMLGLPAELVGAARVEEALFRSLSVNTLSDSYSRPIGGSDAPITVGWAFGLLIAARWIGAVVFFATLLKVVVRLFLQSILTWICKRFARDHVVIVGDRPFADHIAETAAARGVSVVHFKPDGRETTRNGILTLDSNQSLTSILTQSGAHKARSLVFAMEDNAESAELADRAFDNADFKTMARRASDQSFKGTASRHGPHIFVCLDDGWFEHREQLSVGVRQAEASGQTNDGDLDSVIEVLSESRLAARAVLTEHPLFALAEASRQHVLIVGLGAMGEALLTEICETQRTDTERKQIISIVDPDPTTWARFKRRCPEWDEVFEGHFYPCRIDDLDDGLTGLVAAIDAAPLTAAFVTTGAGTDPAIAAARLKQLVDIKIDENILRDAHARFPIFTCVRGGSGERTQPGAAIDDDAPMPIIHFGAWDSLVHVSRILEDQPDAMAFEVHSVHARLNAPAGQPAENWSAVAEPNRYSSRSAAAFIPTLLYAAGFDLSVWIANRFPDPPSPNELPDLPGAHTLNEDPSERVMLARLEHIRWCAERRLRGWRHAEVTDKARKRHANLVGFDALPLKQKRYNIDYIAVLSDALKAEQGPCVIPEREGALRALVRPTDFDLLEEIGALTVSRTGLNRELTDG